jgi:hypothetical protein
VALAFFCAGTAWALSSAPGSSPDDNFHLASIWCAWGTDANNCHVQNGTHTVPADVVNAACFAFNSSTSGACSYALKRDFVPAAVNSGEYPGLFYLGMRGFVGNSVAGSVVRMRIANVCLATVLLGAAIAFMPPLLRRAVALSWLGTLVPLFMFLVPSTNPSSWVVIGVGTYWAWLLMFWTTSNRREGYLAGGFALFSAVLAGGARADGAAYIGLSTVLVAIVAVRDRRTVMSPKVLLPTVVVAAMSIIYLTAGQSHSLSGFGSTIGPGRSGPELLEHNIFYLPNLLLGVFGVNWGLGWLDTIPLPAVGALSFSAAAFLALQSAPAMWRRKAVAVALPVLALFFIPLRSLQGGGNFVGENVQPRYLLPLVTITLGLFLFAEDSPSRSWYVSPRAMTVIVVALSYANALMLWTELRRYVTGIDAPLLNLDTSREWWWHIPVTPMGIWIFGSLATLGLFAALARAGFLRQEASDPVLETTPAIAD